MKPGSSDIPVVASKDAAYITATVKAEDFCDTFPKNAALNMWKIQHLNLHTPLTLHLETSPLETMTSEKHLEIWSLIKLPALTIFLQEC